MNLLTRSLSNNPAAGASNAPVSRPVHAGHHGLGHGLNSKLPSQYAQQQMQFHMNNDSGRGPFRWAPPVANIRAGVRSRAAKCSHRYPCHLTTLPCNPPTTHHQWHRSITVTLSPVPPARAVHPGRQTLTTTSTIQTTGDCCLRHPKVRTGR